MAKDRSVQIDTMKFERGSGNVFADLDRPNAKSHMLKAELVTRIDEIIRRYKLKPGEAAKQLGLSQSDVSRLLQGGFREYSVEHLLCLLMAMGYDVNIVIRKPRSRRQDKLRVGA